MRFNAPAALPFNIRLLCVDGCVLEGTVSAYVEGIRIGQLRCSQSFSVGQPLDVPVDYFPHVSLPTKIRFALDGSEFATPLTISGSEDVMTIVGHGDIRVENLSLDNGLLRGTIVNASNGIFATGAFIKINGQVVRSVALETAKAREEGGSATRFVVPIRPADLAESGLHVDIFVNGVEYPIAHYTHVRKTASNDERRLIELDEKLRQMQKATSLQTELLRETFERDLKRQQERIDSFIEYAMSLIMDKLARQSGLPDPGELREAAHQLKSFAAPRGVYLPAPLPAFNANINLHSAAFTFGWYAVETRDEGDFRWMGMTALIRNPFVSRYLSRVELTVSDVYGVSTPILRATLDQQELTTNIVKEGNLFRVILTAPADERICGESISLESLVVGCPAVDSGTGDERLLSIAVTHVNIFYEAAIEMAA